MFLSARGLITVPGAVALAIWAAAGVTLWIDHQIGQKIRIVPVIGAALNYDTSASVLSTIASASITTLSLVYSIVLVVFTLAAGTIAPRLLKRFSQDRTNQMTAGLLGGTFLYSLSTLSALRPDFLPALSGSIAFLLAVLAVLQLIYFVHSVSVSVMIDEEIAAISRTLNEKMQEIVKVDEEADNARTEMPENMEDAVASPASGFLSVTDPRALVALAAHQGLVLDFCAAPGMFVAEGEPLFRYKSSGDAGMATDEDDLCNEVAECIALTAARENTKDVVFSLNLLLEIALRALSPGVNDTYTAITCCDRLGETLQAPVRKGIRENIHLDENGVPRLRIPGLTLEHLLQMAIPPLRQCASDNDLFLNSLAAMIRRLFAISGSERSRTLLSGHAKDLIRGHEANNPLPADLDRLKDALGPVWRSIENGAGQS
nr:DUF2254 family protein [Roseibium sp. RKSG952]